MHELLRLPGITGDFVRVDEPDLEKLLAASAAGDEAAFRKLYDTAAPRLLAVARRLLHDHHRAEDALQQAMISAWNRAGDFDPARGRASTWLIAIVRNRAIDLMRSENRQHTALTDERHDVAAVLGRDAPQILHEPLSATVAQRLGECFEEIGAQPSASIRLAYLDGLTFREIAARLKSPLGTVKSWVRRGLLQLRECIER